VGDCSSRKTPTKMKVKDVVAVRAGSHHSALLTSGSAIHVCGDNSYHQILLDQPRSVLPAKLPITAEDVFLGSDFTYFLKAGGLYAAGRNDFGQLGLGHTKKVGEPMPVGVGKQRILEIVARESTVVLLEDGGIYVWGLVATKSTHPIYMKP
jgi:alpha-tubulin suppressor-like RCC1 family protein